MTLPETTQEPIRFVDATPDNEYPLRILKAYRENCNYKWIAEPPSPFVDAMNELQDKRASILDHAISLLERNNEGKTARLHFDSAEERKLFVEFLQSDTN